MYIMQEKCYFGDMENPVADVAAQTAAALALVSRVLTKHGNAEEVALGGTYHASYTVPDSWMHVEHKRFTLNFRG
jgi:hypothetical protein